MALGTKLPVFRVGKEDTRFPSFSKRKERMAQSRYVDAEQATLRWGESSCSVRHQSNRLYNQPLAGFDFSRRALGRVDPFLVERTDRKGLAREHFTSSTRLTSDSKNGSLFVLMFSSWMALFEVSYSFISFHTSLVINNKIYEKRILPSHTNYVRFLVH